MPKIGIYGDHLAVYNGKGTFRLVKTYMIKDQLFEKLSLGNYFICSSYSKRE